MIPDPFYSTQVVYFTNSTVVKKSESRARRRVTAQTLIDELGLDA